MAAEAILWRTVGKFSQLGIEQLKNRTDTNEERSDSKPTT